MQRCGNWTADEKVRLVKDVPARGQSVSPVQSPRGERPSALHLASANGARRVHGPDDEIVPASELRVAQRPTHEPQRLPGKRTPPTETPREAMERVIVPRNCLRSGSVSPERPVLAAAAWVAACCGPR